MFKLLVDTSVWLDVAKDPQQHSLLAALEELVKLGEVSLIVPRVVLDEFNRNRDRIVQDSTRSLLGVFKRVKEAVDKFGDPKKKRAAITQIDDVGHKIPVLGGAAIGALDRIERLLAGAPIIETADEFKLRAAQRALEGKAPFHRNKNEIGDAIILETYAACVREKTAKKVRFAFVTHNTSDFSAPQANQKLPHPDLAPLFTKIRSLYFVSLPEALRRVKPGFVSDLLSEHEMLDEPRGLTEILALINELVDKVWYNRHQLYKELIERGEIQLVEKETFPIRAHERRPIERNIWEQAERAARSVEKKYGRDNLGPWDDFEWGMLNGKLSALRWALGEEWEGTLDT